MTTSTANQPSLVPAYPAIAPPAVLTDFKWACEFFRHVTHRNSHAKVRALLQANVDNHHNGPALPLLDLPWQVVTGYFQLSGRYHSWLVLKLASDPPYWLDLCPIGGVSGPVLYNQLPPCWGMFREVRGPLDHLVTAQEIADCVREYQRLNMSE